MSRTTHFTNDLDRIAHKRASRKIGWYMHAFVFVLVNLGLMAVAALSGKPWVIFPAFGWAMALIIHGLFVFVFMPGNGLREGMVARERARLTAMTATTGQTAQTTQRDPW